MELSAVLREATFEFIEAVFGRPDPTPELFVEESKDAGGWLKAGWRYNKK